MLSTRRLPAWLTRSLAIGGHGIAESGRSVSTARAAATITAWVPDAGGVSQVPVNRCASCASCPPFFLAVGDQSVAPEVAPRKQLLGGEGLISQVPAGMPRPQSRPLVRRAHGAAPLPTRLRSSNSRGIRTVVVLVGQGFSTLMSRPRPIGASGQSRARRARTAGSLSAPKPRLNAFRLPQPGCPGAPPHSFITRNSWSYPFTSW